jgi:hypothetical protein
MKRYIILIAILSIILLILFFWQEWNDLSYLKKINPEKFSSFFSALGSILTAITVYLLYAQYKEQIEDRKAASRPDLYPEDQFFSVINNEKSPMVLLKREKKIDELNGLFNIHNIGFGAAKEISIKWHFSKELISLLISPEFIKLYSNFKIEQNYSFINVGKNIEVQFPIMYLASLSYFKNGWSEMKWEELFLEISHVDIHDFKSPSKFFKVDVYVNSNYASFRFSRVNEFLLSNSSTMKSMILLNPV